MKPLQILLLFLLLAAIPSRAVTIYGVTAANELVYMDTSKSPLLSFSYIGTISQPGIVDIDVFPATGQLYGITSTGNAYELNPATAAATFLFAPSQPISNITDFDFNPKTDEMHLIGTGNQIYRMIPATTTAPSAPGLPGAVTYDGTYRSALTGDNLELVANAFSNNFDGTNTTRHYTIDSRNAHSLNEIYPGARLSFPWGDLGIPLGTFVGFDIAPDGVAYLSNDNYLYTVNFQTGGLVTALGLVRGNHTLASIAVAPEPGSAALTALGGLLVLRRRRKRMLAWA